VITKHSPVIAGAGARLLGLSGRLKSIQRCLSGPPNPPRLGEIKSVEDLLWRKVLQIMPSGPLGEVGIWSERNSRF
jgi:hypothetical protein